MARPKIVMKDKLYIPAKFLQEDKVVKAYTHYEFDDNICRACDLRDSRPCADCRSCEWGGLKQSFNMAGYKVVGKIPYYTFPLGDIDNVERKLNLDLDRFDFVDLTVRRKFTYPIEFTGDLFDYQETPVALLVKRKMGILKSKPRTGKTVMAVAAAVRNQNRTIIMADQKDFLDGFYETIEAMTNLPALEEETGKKLFGFPKTLKDYETFQIILITYQQLIKDSKISRKRMQLLRKFYGALIVDEVHRSATPTFSKVLSRMTTRMRIGLSATPRRKDCLVAGSLVVMSDGSRKAIEDVVVGDEVLSFNTSEGVFEPKPVVMTHAVATDKRIVRVRHSDGVLECTEDHEVWTANRGYVKAIELTPADVIQLSLD